jgi:hypothetical protein
MEKIIYLNEKRTDRFGEKWTRDIGYDGVTYQCSVRRGKRVRIPYKPRGQNIGYHWFGTVYADGRKIFTGRVVKSLGCRGLLKAAGVVSA